MYRHFRDAVTQVTRQRGKQTVPFAIDRQAVDHLAPKQFEAAVDVVQLEVQHVRDEPVVDARGENLVPGIAPGLFPPDNDIAAFLEFLEEGGDFLGVVLKIGVHGEDQLARNAFKARGKRDRLAEIAPEPDDFDLGVLRAQGRELFVGAVGASIVDEEELYIVPAGVLKNSLGDSPNRVTFVKGGDDKAQLHAGGALLPMEL